jgi:type II secretion system protein D
MEHRIKLIKKTKYILCLIVILSLVFIKPADVRSADEKKSLAQADQQDVRKTDKGTLPSALPVISPEQIKIWTEQQKALTGSSPEKTTQPGNETSQPATTEPAPQQEKIKPETETQQPSGLQIPPVPGEPGKRPVPPARVTQPGIPQSAAASAPTVSFFFDDADVFEVAQTIFADILKVNYIIDPQVKGRVNFRTINPIPKDEVLSVMEIIFRLNGIGFVEEGGLYRILPLAEVSKELIFSQIGKPPEKVAMEMFAFKNLDIKESMPDIENALGLHLKGGTVRILPIFRMNALIVVATSKESLEYIRKWVEVFDKMFASARPKIFVYALQNSKATHIASLLQSIFTGSSSSTSSAQPPPAAPAAAKPAGASTTAPSAPSSGQRVGAAATVSGGGSFVAAETRVFADEITNSLIILATPADYSFIEETVKRLDIMPRQVVIEGLIARIDLTDNLSFGLSWSLKTGINIKAIKPFANPINLDGLIGINPGGLDTTQLPAKGFTFVGTDSKNMVRAVITALAEESKAKVLAAPHILVSDNREARIQVGRQVPIATSTTSTITATGSTEATTSIPVTSTIQYKDIGIILKVKPQVNDSGLISLEITQEISSLGETVKVGGQDETSINKTEATTNLVAQDGDTIIIGGLIQEDISKSKDGIPFLSKIPLIGNLFGSTTDKNTRTELIILLTPHVIKTLKEAADVTTGYVDRYQSGTKDKDINKFIQEKSQQEKDSGNSDKKMPNK